MPAAEELKRIVENLRSIRRQFAWMLLPLRTRRVVPRAGALEACHVQRRTFP
jgi:hypothetical protein